MPACRYICKADPKMFPLLAGSIISCFASVSLYVFLGMCFLLCFVYLPSTWDVFRTDRATTEVRCKDYATANTEQIPEYDTRKILIILKAPLGPINNPSSRLIESFWRLFPLIFQVHAATLAISGPIVGQGLLKSRFATRLAILSNYKPR